VAEMDIALLYFYSIRMLAACFSFIPMLAASLRHSGAPHGEYGAAEVENSGPYSDEDEAMEIDNRGVFKSLQ
jgi:hypothetical protein